MGYYTNYNIKITPDSDEVRAYIDADDNLSYALDEDADSCKWYNHEDDMLRLSREFPDVLFELTGEGEGAGDLWRKYFKNGKVQRCPAIITYEAFDESKLTEVTN